MTNKIIITHPSKDHVSLKDFVVWPSKADQGFDAIWVGDGDVTIIQVKDTARPASSRGRKGGSREHIIPEWMILPHHGSDCDERPPQAAERLLDLIPLKYREHLVGDLEEMYKSDLLEHGVQKAQRRYWKQVGLSFVPIIWTVIKEVAGLAVLLKLIR